LGSDAKQECRVVVVDLYSQRWHLNFTKAIDQSVIRWLADQAQLTIKQILFLEQMRPGEIHYRCLILRKNDWGIGSNQWCL
jgi:hypothetical protein